MANTYNARMCLSGNRTKRAPTIERPSSKGKVSGSVPDSVTLSHCWFLKKYSALTSVSL